MRQLSKVLLQNNTQNPYRKTIKLGRLKTPKKEAQSWEAFRYWVCDQNPPSPTDRRIRHAMVGKRSTAPASCPFLRCAILRRYATKFRHDNRLLLLLLLRDPKHQSEAYRYLGVPDIPGRFHGCPRARKDLLEMQGTNIYIYVHHGKPSGSGRRNTQRRMTAPQGRQIDLVNLICEHFSGPERTGISFQR